MDDDNLLKKLNKFGPSGDVSYCNLEDFRIKLPTHLSNRLPAKFIIIESLNTEFSAAIQQLKKQDVIGVSLEGSNIGRSGTLEWLNISSSECTYLFNIGVLGEDAFDNGLRIIFENKRIVKIFHDCRRASDCFYHQYSTKPLNVYDTQVADFVANAIRKNVDLITNEVNSLNYCLESYLNVPKEYLYKHFDSILTLSSPNQDLSCFFVKNVIYLRLLKQELDMILRMPFRRCVDVYLNVNLRKSDQELKLHPPEPGLVPPELVMENMRLFKFTEKLKPRESSKLEDKNDPLLRYERDCKKYQQKYGYGKFASNKEPETRLDHENVDSGWSCSNRGEVVQFLLDRMFACDSSDRSVISMTPFENLTERDECSVTSENYRCYDKSDQISVRSKRKNFPKANNNSENSQLLKSKSSLESIPLQKQTALPSKVTNTLVDRGTSPINIATCGVDTTIRNISSPNPVKSTNCRSFKSVSSSSSLSTKSQVNKVLPEQNNLLNSEKRLSRNSAFLNTNTKDGTKILSPEKDTTESFLDCSSGSSLSGKSEVYKIFAVQKLVSVSEKQIQGESVVANKDVMKNASSFYTKESSNRRMRSVSNISSNSSLSGKSEVYNNFAKQNSEKFLTESSIFANDSDLHCVELNSTNIKDSACDQSLVKESGSSCSTSHEIPTMATRLKKIRELTEIAKSQYNSQIGASASFNMCSNETKSDFHIDKELTYQHDSNSDSMNGDSVFAKDINSFGNKFLNEEESKNTISGDNVNSDRLEKDTFSTSEDEHCEDPWRKLRDAFAELGPTKYSTKKVVFVPAGMQY